MVRAWGLVSTLFSNSVNTLRQNKVPLKQLYSCFRGGPPAGRATCGRLLPLWTPHPYAYAYTGRQYSLLPPRKDYKSTSLPLGYDYKSRLGRPEWHGVSKGLVPSDLKGVRSSLKILI
jgi:hypothetical protein